MNICAGDNKFWVDVRFAGELASPVTGRMLRQYEVDASILEDDAAAFNSGLLTGLTMENGLTLVGRDGHQYTVVQGGRHYSVILTEREEINPGTVKIGSVTLAPAQYRESVSGDERTITLIADTDESILRELFSLYTEMEPVDVRRPDLGDTTFSMKMTNFKYADESGRMIVAVSLTSDIETLTSVPLLSQIGAAGRTAAEARAVSRVLVRKLVANGVLSESDVAEMDTDLEAEFTKEQMALHLVRSLSDCRLED